MLFDFHIVEIKQIISNFSSYRSSEFYKKEIPAPPHFAAYIIREQSDRAYDGLSLLNRAQTPVQADACHFDKVLNWKKVHWTLPGVVVEVAETDGALAAATAEAMVGRSLYDNADFRAQAEAAVAAADFGAAGSAHSITVNGKAKDLSYTIKHRLSTDRRERHKKELNKQKQEQKKITLFTTN